MKPSVFVYVINVDWYFKLHWLQRAIATKDTGAVVHVVAGFTDSDILDSLEALGFICHPLEIERKSINPFSNIKVLTNLYFLIKSIAPDIIHAITIKPNLYVGLISRRLKIPYVLSVTGTGIIFSGKSLTVRLIRPVVRFLYKLTGSKKVSRKIVFENREDCDYFVSTGLCDAKEAVVILGAGVDTGKYRLAEEKVSAIPVILFAARLLWDKGLGDLVEAGKILHNRNLDFAIQVAGIVDEDSINTIDEAVLEDWERDGLIQWLGTVKDMPELIAKANIVTLPTFYGEGVPRILIEAAACGRPIITTDMPGCREIVKDGVNGLLVPARDVKALADAIEVLLNDRELRNRMGRQGREMVERDFSQQKVIGETISLYDELGNTE